MTQPTAKIDLAPDSISILIVDDEVPIQRLLSMMIARQGYRCLTASSGQEAIDKIQTEHVDIVITDINMPGMSGVELMRHVKKMSLNIDFIVITGFVADFSYEHIIEEGASDFIYKPMNKNELLLRLRRVIRERFLMTDRNRINEKLEQNVQQLRINSEELNLALSELKNTHQKLRSAYVDTINRLVIASEYKDEDTGDHIIRMSRYCELLAQKTDLSKEEIMNVRYASPMHDIGKIGIPDSILLKPGKLTGEEFDIIKSHTTIGGKILIQSNAKVLQTAYDIAMTHHEKWNGQGYPRGLKKNQIPLIGRIVGIADVFDALTSNRPYKEAYPVNVACDIIRKERENHFDPNMVDIFLDHINDIVAIKNSVGVIEDLSITDFQWSERDLQNGVDTTTPEPS
jgi:putative two-component system response regulator